MVSKAGHTLFQQVDEVVVVEEVQVVQTLRSMELAEELGRQTLHFVPFHFWILFEQYPTVTAEWNAYTELAEVEHYELLYYRLALVQETHFEVLTHNFPWKRTTQPFEESQPHALKMNCCFLAERCLTQPLAYSLSMAVVVGEELFYLKTNL